ncbi:MAG TPA: hypothetical protein VMV46_08865 [Thermoanaerobaculia bacterium]|nr:hypothetical protein [Thermoanaerobaculia bacterium]
MACSIHFDPDSGIARVILTPGFTTDEIVDAFARAWSDPAWRWRALIDVRAGFPKDWSVEQDSRSLVRFVQARKPAQAPRGRIAILVAREVDYGLARAFEIISEPANTTDYLVTRSEAEAIAWLQASGEEPTDAPTTG